MSQPLTPARRSGLIRLALVAVALAVVGGVLGAWPSATSSTFPAALAAPTCGPGAL
jgi:hypothetical protein